MNFKKIHLILSSLLLLLVSCKKHTPGETAPVKTVFAGPNVFVSGNALSGNYTTAVYWRNDTLVTLMPTGGAASAVAAQSSDVYVAGTLLDSGGVQQAVYWKNGALVVLGHGAAYTILVSGGDVYVGGIATFPTSDPSYTYQVGAYWKNGKIVMLSGVDPYTRPEAVNAIAVAGNDVYVAGYCSDIYNDGSVATYWKNGTPDMLTVPYDIDIPNSAATGIALRGTDVYITGATTPNYLDLNSIYGAVYWKNGVLDTLSNNAPESIITAAASDGANIYFCGRRESRLDVAVYWKNIVATTLVDHIPNKPGYILVVNTTGICPYQGDVYVSGYLDNYSDVLGDGPGYAGYWKNAQFVSLKGGSNGYATGIAVAPLAK